MCPLSPLLERRRPLLIDGGKTPSTNRHERRVKELESKRLRFIGPIGVFRRWQGAWGATGIDAGRHQRSATGRVEALVRKMAASGRSAPASPYIGPVATWGTSRRRVHNGIDIPASAISAEALTLMKRLGRP